MADTLKKLFKERKFQPPDIQVWIPPSTEIVKEYRIIEEFIPAYETELPGNIEDDGPVQLLPQYASEDSLDGGSPDGFYVWRDDRPNNSSIPGNSGSTTTFTQIPRERVEVVTTEVEIPGYHQTVTPPLQTVLDADLNWNGSAISFDSFSIDGQIEFKLSTNNVGSVCGLSLVPDTSSDYLSIKHGFKSQKDRFQVYDNGSFRSSNLVFTDDDVFKIERVNGVVSYYLNTTLIYTSNTTSIGELAADASLYAAEDVIIDAAIQSNSYGRSDISFEPIKVVASEGPYGISDLSLEPLSITAYTKPVIKFEPLIGIGSEGPYGIADIAFQVIEAESYGNLLTISVGQANVFFEPVIGNGSGFAGAISFDDQMDFEPLLGIGSEGSYGIARLEFSPLQVDAYNQPYIVDGACKIVDQSTSEQGSGILLYTGQHILTAAHVVEGMVNFPLIDIEFYTEGEIYIEPVSVVNILIHPDYDGDFRNGYDLAVIYLKNPVTPLVGRHQIYKGDLELNNVFKRTSYSPRVNPLTGQKTDAGWDITHNLYEDYGNDLSALKGNNIPFNSTIAFDFDPPGGGNDAFGTEFGITGSALSNEGFVSPGDSGSAALLNGYIAGVLSYISSTGSPPDVLEGAQGTYGEFGVDTRVSYFQDWVTALLDNTGQGHLTGFDSIINAKGVAEFGIGRLSGFNASIYGYSGGTSLLNRFSTELTGVGVSDPYGVASLSVFDTAILSYGLSGSFGTAKLSGFSSNISAYSAGQGVVSGFTSKITASGLSGTSSKARLPGFDTRISSEVISPAWGVARLSGFLTRLLWGEGRLNGFSTSIYSGDLAQNNSIAYVVNVFNNETTTYTNYDFLYITKLGGKYYGVKADGLYLLEGHEDDGVAIESTIKTSVMDFGTSLLKRVPYVYLDSDTQTELTAVCDEIKTSKKYKSSFDGRRTRLGKGLKGRFWSFELSNIKGQDFKIGSIEILAKALSRKV